MTIKDISKKRIFFLCIFLLSAFLVRIYNLDWDNGHFLHPDERLYVNISSIALPTSWNQFFSVDSPLNPKMFYYGAFPLYLYKVVSLLLSSSSFLLTSRFISALFSFATIPFIFLIGKTIFTKRIGSIAAIIFAFSAGSIQHAHFNTTESMLVFFVSVLTYLSVRIAKEKQVKFFLLCGILTGLSFATKITGLTFALLPFVAWGYLLLKEKNKLRVFLWGVTFIIVTAIVGIIAAPYQLIDHQQFLSDQTYMQGVTYGKSKPPFVIIYEGTLPYIYPLIHVLPFTFGFIELPLALIGCTLLLRKPKKNFLLLFILLYPLFYFAWSGAWFTKFSRYYMLLFPFLSIWAAYSLSLFSKRITAILLALCLLQGILFLRIYTEPNTRVEASSWIYKHIPEGTTIAGEHWDDNLPLPIEGIGDTSMYTVLQIPSYDLDTTAKVQILANTLEKSAYVILSSRRVYHSLLVNQRMYPYTSSMYKKLFDGTLGYTLVQEFTSYPYFFSDDTADETFQSYDHPPVLIFQNTKHVSSQQISRLLLQ